MAENLIAYVKSCRAQGIPQDIIETNLVQVGWTKEEIDQAVEQLNFQSEEEKPSQPEPKESDSQKKFFAIFAIFFFILCLAVAGSIYYFVYLQKPKEPPIISTSAAVQQPTPTATSSPIPATSSFYPSTDHSDGARF